MSPPPCKQIYDLTLDDLTQYKIWEYLSEDNDKAEDECTVIGNDGQYVDVENMCVVLTKFYMRDGTSHMGYIDPAYYSRNTGATIFFPKGTVSFWFGICEPNEAEIKEYYDIMGKTHSEVFPLLWESMVPISGRFSGKNGCSVGPLIPQSGTIEGFGYFDAKSRRIIYKT